MVKKARFKLFDQRGLHTLLIFGGLLCGFMLRGPSHSQAATRNMADQEGQILTNTIAIFMPLLVNGLDETTQDNAIAAWQANTAYAIGAQVTYQGNPYQCRQAHTSQIGWEPPTAPALWQLITNNATATPMATTTPTIAGPTATPTGPTPTPTSTSTSGWPNRLFAPYVDVMLWPTFPLAQTATTTGQKYYTLGFIISDGGCTAAWGGVTPLSQNFLLDDINNLRTQGGNVVISFGGASGVELGQACTTVATLQAQYQAVIDKYQFTSLDFDIEGAASADAASITRRNQAIAGLQAAANSAGKTLKISYTLPVLPSGLTGDGVNLLNNAIANGVKISVVNIMAMDYGSVAPPNEMGANAIQAANSLFGQLQPLYPAKTETQRWAMIGVTPMIGLNDVSPEVFTLNDAQVLLAFAQQKNIALLAMWSSTRDQQCLGNPAVSATCSGVAQTPWAFTALLKPFTQ